MRAPEPLTPRPRAGGRAEAARRRGGRPGRRPQRWLALSLIGLILLFVLLWFGPRLADWSAHRAAVEAVASEILGREVQISGEIHLILLPQPSIAAEKVSVNDGGDGVRMTTAGLTLNLSLAALVTGRIAVTHVELDRPDIRLPWPLPGGPDAIEPPPWLATLSADVTHGSFTFGQLRVRDADVSVVTGGSDNALAVDGTATAGGLPLQVDLALGWPSSDGSAHLHLALASTGGPATSFDLGGSLMEDGRVTGQFTTRGADLSAFVAAPAQAFTARGTLSGDARAVQLTNLAATIGTMPVNGDVTASLPGAAAAPRTAPRLTIRLHTPVLDLAPWLKAFPAASGKTLPLMLVFDADSAVYGDGLLRHFGVTLASSPQRLRVDSLTATLPGEAALTLAGFFDPAASSFSGRLKLGAPSPLATLHWLAQAHLIPPLDSALPGLDTLAIDAAITALPGQVALTGIQGLMNDTTMTGGIVMAAGSSPKISAGLTFGRVDVGQWLPADWLVRPPRPDLIAQAFGDIDADVQLAASELWLGDDRLNHAVLDADIDHGSLNLRQFAAEDGGMQILASGAMDGKGVLSNGRLAMAAPHATPLVDLLPRQLRGVTPDFWSAPLTASLSAAGPPTALALNAQGKLGDLGFSAQPVLDLVHGQWHGALTLQHPSAARLLQQLGFGHSDDWLGQGSLSIVADAASNGADWRIAPLAFSLGLLHGSGHLETSTKAPPDERRTTGALALTVLPWPRPDAVDPLPFDLLQGWNARIDLSIGAILNDLSPLARQVRANLDVTDGVLRLALEHAQLLGGNAFGTMRLDSADPPQVSLDLGLQNAVLGVGPMPAWLPQGLSAQALNADVVLSARGYSLASWRASLTGTAQVAAVHGSLPRLALAAARQELQGAAARNALFSGSTPFDNLTATARVDQGELTLGTALLAGSAGQVTASGGLDLVRGVCNLSFVLAPKPAAGQAPVPAVNAFLRGPLADPAAWAVSSAPAPAAPH